MACNCTDLLDDIDLKFDLILELINTILGLIGLGGGDDRRIVDRYAKARKEDKELLELISTFLEII